MKKQKLITYFDCESDMGRASFATCLSVSWITCDVNDDFKIIDNLSGTLNSKFRYSRPFEVDAMLAHNIPVADIMKQKLSNGELVDRWDKSFRDLSEKGTIFAGFNNMNYDNILLNNSLFVNLKFPYITSKQQFDILPAVRACSVFSPDALRYELNAKGNKSFKLQSMIKANGISTTRAHDSYEDTRVTLLLSKLLKEKSPDIFNAALALRRKTDVLPKIKKEKIFCWHESFFKTKIYCGTYIGEQIFPGWYYLYDLRKNPEDILSLNINDLKEEISKSKKWVRTLKANRSPIIMDKKYSMLDEEYKEIGYSEINKRYKLIEKHREELSHKLRIIDEEKFKDKLDFDQENKLAEEKIYTLNIKNEERKWMNEFNEDHTKRTKAFSKLSNDIKTLAEMKIFDNYSKDEFCEIFSLKDYKRVKRRVAEEILDTSNKHSPFTKIPEQQARIDTLRVIAEKVEDETKINQLNELDDYLEGMKKDFEQAS